MWMINTLADQVPAIEAQEDLHLIQATSYPNMKPHGQKKVLRELTYAAEIKEDWRDRLPEIIEEDPAKAAEWFAEQGIRVESATTPED